MLPSRFKTRPNSLLKLSAMSLVVATLSGCGEDAKDCGGFWDKTFGREECAVATPVATTSTPTPQAQVLTGKFVDSPVEGLTYKTPTQSGMTGSNGEFKYLEGESVEFFVNKQPLSAIVGRPMLHVYDFNQGAFLRNIDFGNRVAALLQSLDEDGVPGNGIKLGSKAQAIFSTPKNLELYGSETDFNSSLSVILTDGGIGHFVSLTDAKEHALQYTSADLYGCPVVATTVKLTGMADVYTDKLSCVDRQKMEYFLAEYSPMLRAKSGEGDETIQRLTQSLSPEAINKLIKENFLYNYTTNVLDGLTAMDSVREKKYIKGGTAMAKASLQVVLLFMPNLKKEGTTSKVVVDMANYMLENISTSVDCFGKDKNEGACLKLIKNTLEYYQSAHGMQVLGMTAAQEEALKPKVKLIIDSVSLGAEIVGADDLNAGTAAGIASKSLVLMKDWALSSYTDEQIATDWVAQSYGEFMDVTSGILDAASDCADFVSIETGASSESDAPAPFKCMKGLYSQGVENLGRLTLRGEYIVRVLDNSYDSLGLRLRERALRNILAYGQDTNALSRAWGIDLNQTVAQQQHTLVEKILADFKKNPLLINFMPDAVNVAMVERQLRNDLMEIEQNAGKSNNYFTLTMAADPVTSGNAKVLIKINHAMPLSLLNDLNYMACQVEGPGSQAINPKLRTGLDGSVTGDEWEISPNFAGNYLATCRFYGGRQDVANKGVVIGRASVGFSYAPAIQRTIKIPSGAAFATHELEFKTEGAGIPPLVGWDFGDGSAVNLASADASIKHTFSQPGNYTLHLYSLSADFSYESTLILHVQSADLPIIDASPIEPHVGDTVTFSLSTVWEDIKEVIWRFGDMVEGIVKAIGDTITYVFEREGVWKVSATAVDTAGQHIGRTEMEVGVKPAALLPVASLVGSAITGVVGQPVVFVLSNSKALEGKLCSYTFVSGGDVGDSGGGDCSNASQVLNLPSITASYTTAGTFTATLTVTDSQGRSATATWLVNVSDATQTASSGFLNDTGIAQCANDNTVFADCSAANLGGWFGLNQDGETGRDFLAIKGTLSKTGAGDAGFDFTKISATGQKLPTTATEWSCVLDNHTGLLWEIKTNDGGVRDKDFIYTWYNPDVSTNGGTVGYENGGYNTQAFVQATNQQALCGYNDWRLPSKQELHSILDIGKFNPSVDSIYFPNTQADYYWTSSPVASNIDVAWVVSFSNGDDSTYGKQAGNHIRLVSSTR